MSNCHFAPEHPSVHLLPSFHVLITFIQSSLLDSFLRMMLRCSSNLKSKGLVFGPSNVLGDFWILGKDMGVPFSHPGHSHEDLQGNGLYWLTLAESSKPGFVLNPQSISCIASRAQGHCPLVSYLVIASGLQTVIWRLRSFIKTFMCLSRREIY